ncbi:Protein DA1-related 1 [Platanthera zijinensis]|uniref:Protein DA1-related 1 n=1 Tax=Platanthera zijinensis TaxID=2320716 RepID=A0AAP0GEP3_9ASPA
MFLVCTDYICYSICAGCDNEIGRGEFLNLKDGVYPWYFRCHACDQPIIGFDFKIYDDHPYHISCCQNLHHKKCDVCKEVVSVKHSLPIDYLVLPIWMQKTCASHEHDGTHLCFSCNRKETKDASYIRMDDRVMLCLECLESSIMDTVECQPLYQEIQKFYKGLNMKFDQEIQLHLVERFSLCRIQIGSFLAHEIMHAWLRINGYGKLDPHVEEGICDVMSYMWLDFEIMSISGSNIASSSTSTSSTRYIKNQRSQFQRKLAQICKYKMENRKVPIYGEGFHAGYAAVLKYGLKSVLNHIKLKGSFPC